MKCKRSFHFAGQHHDLIIFQELNVFGISGEFQISVFCKCNGNVFRIGKIPITQFYQGRVDTYGIPSPVIPFFRSQDLAATKPCDFLLCPLNPSLSKVSVLSLFYNNDPSTQR
jgi:hypothetical protein